MVHRRGDLVREGLVFQTFRALSAEGVELLDENEIVDAVIQRVANRLVNESRRQRKEKKLENLAEKIASRIAGGQ